MLTLARLFPQDVWRGWELSVSSVAYFWFAFALCMPVWVVVPAMLGSRAWRRLDRALAAVDAGSTRRKAR